MLSAPGMGRPGGVIFNSGAEAHETELGDVDIEEISHDSFWRESALAEEQSSYAPDSSNEGQRSVLDRPRLLKTEWRELPSTPRITVGYHVFKPAGQGSKLHGEWTFRSPLVWIG
ncbi:hypothetical protein RIU96_04910 [Corynebacterium sp. Z-1]|uniref:hypothetical protein n=1 Tax=Corynebacterium TaxID=1716 RepID=UPI00119F34B7|nr:MULTISPECIES: hypothetical protein [Corynebacterium]MCT1554671.1 hypothetical protein [Corynebacterium sanguinis]TVS23159.1 hypothetical protein EKI50_03750 [Corynebacterium sanguinis]WNI13764.1 hypothetical protein RIU96_04910 [Corynebacterium sp. Z-1]